MSSKIIYNGQEYNGAIVNDAGVGEFTSNNGKKNPNGSNDEIFNDYVNNTVNNSSGNIHQEGVNNISLDAKETHIEGKEVASLRSSDGTHIEGSGNAFFGMEKGNHIEGYGTRLFSVQEPIPEPEYFEASYIECTGSQYIDTDFKFYMMGDEEDSSVRQKLEVEFSIPEYSKYYKRPTPIEGRGGEANLRDYYARIAIVNALYAGNSNFPWDMNILDFDEGESSIHPVNMFIGFKNDKWTNPSTQVTYIDPYTVMHHDNNNITFDLSDSHLGPFSSSTRVTCYIDYKYNQTRANGTTERAPDASIAHQDIGLPLTGLRIFGAKGFTGTLESDYPGYVGTWLEGQHNVNDAPTINQYTRIRLYGLKIHSNADDASSSTLVHELVPRLYKINGIWTPGLYDKNTGKFYTNDGTGEFNFYSQGYYEFLNQPDFYRSGNHIEGSGLITDNTAAANYMVIGNSTGIFSDPIINGVGNYIPINKVQNGSTYASRIINPVNINNVLYDSVASHVEGYGSAIANTNYAHIEGGSIIDSYNYVIYRHSIDSGSHYAHIEGGGNYINSGSSYSHIEGSYNLISSSYNTHVEGNTNIAESGCSCCHVEGYGSYMTSGPTASHVEGGTYSNYDTNIDIFRNYYSLNLTKTLASKTIDGIDRTVQRSYKHYINSASYSHIEGGNNICNNSGSYFSHLEGYYNTVQNSGAYSHIENAYNIITDSSCYSHVEGQYNYAASGNTHHVEGQYNAVRYGGGICHVEGIQGLATNGSTGTHIEGGDNGNSIIEALDTARQGFITTVTIATYNGDSYERTYNHLAYGSSFSHIEGYRNILYNSNYGHIEGYYNLSKGTSTTVHIEGGCNIAEGGTNYIHIEGQYNSAIGNTNSHIEGGYNTAKGGTDYSHIEGQYNSTDGGTHSHVEGCSNFAGWAANGSHVEGQYNRSDNGSSCSHVEGIGNQASGGSECCHIEGIGDISQIIKNGYNKLQAAVSPSTNTYNVVNSSGTIQIVSAHCLAQANKYCHIEGAWNNILNGGGTPLDPSYTNMIEYGYYYEGVFYSTKRSGVYSNPISPIEGYYYTDQNSSYPYTMYLYTNGEYVEQATEVKSCTTGMGVHAEGILNKIFATGSHAEGIGNIAYGFNAAHIEGYNNTFQNTNTLNGYGTLGTHIEGLKNNVEGGTSLHVEGFMNKVSNTWGNHIEGYKNVSKMWIEQPGQSSSDLPVEVTSSVGSHVEGAYSEVKGFASHAQNLGTITNGQAQTAMGKYNLEDLSSAGNNLSGTYALIIGNGTGELGAAISATTYDNTVTYSVGDYCVRYSVIYRCKTTIDTAEDFDGTKWEKVDGVIDSENNTIQIRDRSNAATLTWDGYLDVSGGFSVNGVAIQPGGNGDIANPNISDAYSNSATYDVGEYCIYQDTLYKCNTAIPVGETFDSAKWTATTIGSELLTIISRVSALETALNGYSFANTMTEAEYEQITPDSNTIYPVVEE